MSLPTYQDFVPLLDFGQWECAVQDFFCDETQGGGLFVKPPDNSDASREKWSPPLGLIPFFTGFQAAVFQMNRSRISLGTVNYGLMEHAKIMDSTGRLWRQGWQVPLDFFVITPADYKKHLELLATVRAVIHMMNPTGTDPVTGTVAQSNIQTTGLNAFLKTHTLSRIWDAGGPTFGGHLTTDKGYYLTPIKMNAIFAVLPQMWPQGAANA